MEVSINCEYKDTAFKDLFGNEVRKANTLVLYNAVNGSSYADVDAITINTLENVIYISYKNDVSFLIGDEQVLWEQQSTPNPNMPYRGLMYFAQLYSTYVAGNKKLHPHGRVLMHLPSPKYVVFYAGAEEVPERQVLRLSDSFSDASPDVEVTCTVINVNAGRNAALLDASVTLSGYSTLIAKCR